MSFKLDIERFARSAGTSLGQAARAIKIELFNGVIRDTRVDTGRLRGNWQTTTGNPAEGEIERLDPGGSRASSDVVQGVKADTVDYLTNNLPYAEVWEERDGMVAKNLARLDRIVRNSGRG